MRQHALGVTLLALSISACAPNSTSMEAQRARLADGARVELKNREGKSVGTLTVATQSGGGARFSGRLTDLSTGVHGVHIHEFGKCQAPDFTSAGGHFNPEGKQHGEFNPQGKHAGDIGNLRVDANGSAEVALLADAVTLGPGETSLLKPGGTSLVIHAGPDDLKTDPSGNSGDRIACGVITR